MNIDMILKLLFLIIILGIAIKTIKFVGGIVFKIVIVLFIILLLYKMFI